MEKLVCPYCETAIDIEKIETDLSQNYCQCPGCKCWQLIPFGKYKKR